jgi:cell division protein FtsA
MARNNEIIVGLDLGTTKICALVGKVKENGIDIIGIGSSPSSGIKKGVIVDIDTCVEATRAALKEAQLMSGYKIEYVCAGISGSHISGFNDEGRCALKGQTVNQKHIDRAIEVAQTTKMDPSLHVLHVIPRQFIIDGQKGIKNPIDMSGQRLESRVHIVTANAASYDNIRRCVESAGIAVSDIILESIASSYAVLSEDEKDLGVVLLDIGGGTSDLTIFYEGSVVYSAVIPIGGNHITQDIAQCLRTPPQAAEEMKKSYGYALASMVETDSYVDIPVVGGRGLQNIPKNILAEVIEARVKETLNIINSELKRSEYYELLSSGIVITGGTSLLKGISELSDMIFDMPVRKGWPTNFGGLRNIVSNPIYSTAVGLVMHASKSERPSNSKIVSQGKGLYDKMRSGAQLLYEELF